MNRNCILESLSGRGSILVEEINAGSYKQLILCTPTDSVFFSRESASMVMAAPGKTPGEKQLMITGQGHRNHDKLNSCNP